MTALYAVKLLSDNFLQTRLIHFASLIVFLSIMWTFSHHFIHFILKGKVSHSE